MTVRRLLALLPLAVVAACGGDDPPSPPVPQEAAKPVAREDRVACDVFYERDVARVVLRTSGRRLEEIGETIVERMDSAETSSCGYYAGPRDDVAVKVVLDRALNPAKRYWYRMTELNQRSDNWSGPDPRVVRGVGQDRSYGGGAFWVPSTSKLTAYRDETMLTVIFFVPGVGDGDSSRAAASIARTVYRRLFGDRPPAPPKSLQDRQPRP